MFQDSFAVMVLAFVCMTSVAINILVLMCVIKLYTDFVKTAVFTKKGGGI